MLWTEKQLQKRRWFRLLSIIIILLIGRKVFYSIYHKYKQFPPGPGIGYPFFGYFFHLILSPKKFVTRIAKKYGKIVFVPVGMNNTIYINDSKLSQKLFTKKQFYHRYGFKNGISRPHNFGITEDIKEWKQRRLYAQQSLFKICDSSFILKHTKNILNNEIFEDLDNNYVENKKLFYPLHYMEYIAFNNIFNAIFNKSLSINDKWLNQYLKTIYIRNEQLTSVALLNIFCPIELPQFIVNILCVNPSYEQMLDILLINWMKKEGEFIIDTNKNILKRKNENYNHNNNGYIDLLIKQIKNENITVLKALHDVQIFFIAGLDTTINVSEFGLLILAKYPNIQETVYDELKFVMNKNDKKEFDFDIIQQLHIFRAFIYELLRISDAVPTGIPHTIINDYKMEIDGDDSEYIIPKNSVIHINSHYIHKWQSWNNNDNDNDKDKECKLKEDNDIHFEYWLNDKNEFKMNDNYVGFGVGKRECVGRDLAIKVLFTIFATLMTKYKFIAPNNNPNTIHIKQEWGTVKKVKPKIGIIIQQRKV